MKPTDKRGPPAGRVGEMFISGRGKVRVAVVSETKKHYIIGALPGQSFKLINGHSHEVISGRQTARLPKRALKILNRSEWVKVPPAPADITKKVD